MRSSSFVVRQTRTNQELARPGNRTTAASVYIGEETNMKLSNPINSTDKNPKSANRLFYSKMVSSLLAAMACTMLTPKINHSNANYIDPREHSTDQTTKNIDPGYNWFY
jgi:RNA recognition motif-containing protein